MAEGDLTPSTRLTAFLGAPGKRFASRDLHTVGDLLAFYPRSYHDQQASGHLSDFAVGEQAVLVADVVKATTRRMQRRRGTMLTVVIEDADGRQASLVWFKPYGHIDRLTPGVRGLFRGKVGTYQGGLQLTHPSYALLAKDTGEHETLYGDGLIPHYAPVEQVDDMQITQVVKDLLDQMEPLLDPLPEEVRERRGLVDLATAVRLLHRPRDMKDVGRGRRRLRYDEALVVQTVLAQRRAEYDSEPATPRPERDDGLLAAFDARLPFSLTEGQRRVATEIADDMAGTHPMHRLLQGEVGSGKTVVALRAMLAAVDAGAQAALLAPTEVLAQQHARSIRGMLGSLAEGGMLGAPERATRVELLTGSMPRKERERVLSDVLTAPVGIVVGTHALIQEHVMFADLGLVVVDEQHRFGVEQRDALRAKALRPPHVLVMTATPIPRTVAMTVFGDMEVSSLSELPRGRQPIASHVVPASREDWMRRTWERVAEEVRGGHQAYVVCPRIGEEGDAASSGNAADDGAELTMAYDAPPEGDAEPKERPLVGVHEMLARLAEEPALAGLRVEMLHGRLPADEKDRVMQAFADGSIDVLVSTTVVEVGVDVPNATTMVVMDADRFGISQLHQLRGRVGRGSAGGLCLLVTGTDNPDTVTRLERVAATSDGFALADLDLELRREGDVLGARQSGSGSQLERLRLRHLADVELIEQARADATELVADDPQLSRNTGLAQMVTARLDDEQAAFLERG